MNDLHMIIGLAVLVSFLLHTILSICARRGE